MRLISLGGLRGHGVPLSPRESVAVLHQVCRLSHTHAQAGHWFPAPRLVDLSVSEVGEIIISPRAIAASRPSSDSLTSLIDELLPADFSELSFLPPRPLTPSMVAVHGEAGTARQKMPPGLAAAGDEDVAVLQALFARACAAGVRPWLYADLTLGADPTLGADQTEGTELAVSTDRAVSASTPATHEFHFFDAPAPIDSAPVTESPAPTEPPAVAADEHAADIDHEAMREFEREAMRDFERLTTLEERKATLEIETDPEALLSDLKLDQAIEMTDEERALFSAPFEPTPRPWVRRAALWGLGVNLALGAVIAWPLLPVSSVDHLLARLGGEQPVESGFDAPSTVAGRPAAESRQAAVVTAHRGVGNALLGEQADTADPIARPAGVVLSVASTRDVEGPPPGMGAVSIPGIDAADDVTVAPGGELVAFVSDRDGERGVFVAYRDGHDAARVSGEGRASAPAWSPDAQHLVFARAEADHPAVWNLWMRNMTTGEIARLTSHTAGIVRGASWFPNGRLLCYGHGSRLLVLDVSSGRAHPVNSQETAGTIRAPSVSPDGERIAFDVEGDGIWVWTVSRGSIERVVDEPAASGLTWGPTGSRLFYYSLHAREWRAWQG